MSAQSDRLADFGTNVWLVDEIYQQYLKDPNSVDQAWWDFFADYEPGAADSGKTDTAPTEAATVEAKAEGREQPAPAA